MKALIIDDEELARNIIRAFLHAYPAIEIVGECANGFEGLKAIQELKPDLIFLDIQMPKITGFELLELLDTPPMIVFSTAFNQFAIQAFELNAIDYLLKPYSRERFDAALQKVLQRHQQQSQSKDTILPLMEHVRQQEDMLQRVVVKNGSKIKVIPIDKINYLESQDDYVMIYTAEEKNLKQWTMKYFEEHLPSEHFIRIHRSYMVHIAQIAQLELYEKGTYLLILKNGSKLPVSQTGHTRLKKILKY
ncbi:MAG: LytTR family transcriptional regulator DNA-binding domain-containing protein [Bacteroidota bacterium]